MLPSRAIIPMLGFAIAACSSQTFQEALKDTTGASFQLSYASNTWGFTSTEAMPNSCNDWTLFAGTRIPVACASVKTGPPPGSFANPVLCRPFACTSDGDCPQAGGLSLVCQANVCQDPNKPLDIDDVLALCLATIPRSVGCFDSAPYADPATQTAYDEATAACSGNGCTVPTGCLQP